MMTAEDDANWYSEDAATFGDRVAAAREARNLSTKALARQLGVATKTVNGWEHDVSEPRANKLLMLSGVLNVSVPWLLTGEGQAWDSDPNEAEDIADVLQEVRALRAQMLRSAERLGMLEKRLKQRTES